MKIVYVPMCADPIHRGHINIIIEAAKLGEVTVGLVTDEAIETYKPAPSMSFEDRKFVVEQIKGVAHVIPEKISDRLDPESMFLRMKPDFVVHGDDWTDGPQSLYRTQTLKALSTYGGQIHEPPYTHGISSTDVKYVKNSEN